MRNTFLIAAAALATAVPASAQTKSPVVVASPRPAASAPLAPLPAAERASHDRGLAFARLYLPVDKVKREGIAQARAQFLKTFPTVPENVELEKRYPGSRDAALNASIDQIGKIYDESLPGAQEKVADLVTQYLTGPQLDKVVAFAGSPTGLRVQQAVTDSMAYDQLTAKAGADPDGFKMTGQDVLHAVDPGFVSKLTPAEIREFVAFNTTPTGVRFNRLAPMLVDLVAAETTAMVRDHMTDIQAGVVQAVAQHIATLKAGSK